jgi:hypothetical protein
MTLDYSPESCNFISCSSGKNLITETSNTLTKINGLALYNSGANPINLHAGNMAALTATLSK